MNKDHFQKEYSEFKQQDEIKVPAHLSASILKEVQEDLVPRNTIVFSKLVLTQGFISLITLLFCPQFSLSLTNNHKLFHYFHHNFGPYICMLICGSIFLGIGGLFSSSLLSIAEIKKIKESKVFYYFGLSILALGTLLLFGAKLYFTMTMIWMIGAIVSGVLFFEIGSSLRIKRLNY